MAAWSEGHSEQRVCLCCGGQADRKPVETCAEAKHWHRFRTKLARNNEYRRDRRAQARAAGSVYVAGRGNLARKATRERERHRQIREVLFDRLGTHSCVRCGFSDKRALHFDHRDGGGRQHRASLPSGSAYYGALVSMSADAFRAMFQVLCANCNAIKREEREEWQWRHAGEDPAEADQGLPASA